MGTNVSSLDMSISAPFSSNTHDAVYHSNVPKVPDPGDIFHTVNDVSWLSNALLLPSQTQFVNFDNHIHWSELKCKLNNQHYVNQTKIDLTKGSNHTENQQTNESKQTNQKELAVSCKSGLLKSSTLEDRFSKSLQCARLKYPRKRHSTDYNMLLQTSEDSYSADTHCGDNFNTESVKCEERAGHKKMLQLSNNYSNRLPQTTITKAVQLPGAQTLNAVTPYRHHNTDGCLTMPKHVNELDLPVVHRLLRGCASLARFTCLKKTNQRSKSTGVLTVFSCTRNLSSQSLPHDSNKPPVRSEPVTAVPVCKQLSQTPKQHSLDIALGQNEGFEWRNTASTNLTSSVCLSESTSYNTPNAHSNLQKLYKMREKTRLHSAIYESEVQPNESSDIQVVEAWLQDLNNIKHTAGIIGLPDRLAPTYNGNYLHHSSLSLLENVSGPRPFLPDQLTLDNQCLSSFYSDNAILWNRRKISLSNSFNVNELCDVETSLFESINNHRVGPSGSQTSDQCKLSGKACPHRSWSMADTPVMLPSGVDKLINCPTSVNSTSNGQTLEHYLPIWLGPTVQSECQSYRTPRGLRHIQSERPKTKETCHQLIGDANRLSPDIRIYPVMQNGVKLSNTHYWLLNSPKSHRFLRQTSLLMRSEVDSFLPDSSMCSDSTGGMQSILDYVNWQKLTSSTIRDDQLELSSFNQPVLAMQQAQPFKSSSFSNPHNQLGLDLPTSSIKLSSVVHDNMSPVQRGMVLRLLRLVPEATECECHAVLVGCSWTFEQAMRRLKLELLCRLGCASKGRCERILMQYAWNLKAAKRQLRIDYFYREHRLLHKARQANRQIAQASPENGKLVNLQEQNQ